jgi:hypothetical protein
VKGSTDAISIEPKMWVDYLFEPNATRTIISDVNKMSHFIQLSDYVQTLGKFCGFQIVKRETSENDFPHHEVFNVFFGEETEVQVKVSNPGKDEIVVNKKAVLFPQYEGKGLKTRILDNSQHNFIFKTQKECIDKAEEIIEGYQKASETDDMSEIRMGSM